jgi:hypothetical protein
MGSRVELFARIRTDARIEGVSIRELARRHQVARKTVRDYVRVRGAQIDLDAGRRVGVFVPQEHAPGHWTRPAKAGHDGPHDGSRP